MAAIMMSLIVIRYPKSLMPEIGESRPGKSR